MRPVRTLILKELRQHFWVVGALTWLLAAALVVMLWVAWRQARLLSILQPAHSFLVLFVPLAALVLAHRLVVQEYAGSTQKFLEGLPIGRIQMVSVKFFLGLAYLIGAALAAVGCCALLATAGEPIEARFMLTLILKTTSLVFFIWAMFFVMSFTGRYRIPIYIGLLLLFAFLNSQSELDLSRSGPIALARPDTFVAERDRIPWDLLVQTNVAASGLAALAFLMALLREGSLAEALSRKMSQREKAVMMSFFLLVLVSVAIVETKKTKEPFQFQDESVIHSESHPISILYSYPSIEEEASALLDDLERILGGMIDALGIEELPATRIAYDPSLDTGVFQTASLTDLDGLLVRANFLGVTRINRRDLMAHLVRGLLDISMKGRSWFEPKRWLHDGFSRWWVERGLGEQDAGAEEVLIGRAIVALEHQPDLSTGLARWTLLRERVGEPMAVGLAYSGFRALEEKAGRETVLELAGSVLGRRPARDVRETLHEWRNPMPVVFEVATGMDWLDFQEDWKTWLDARRTAPDVSGILSEVPTMEGSLEVHAREGWIREIVGRLTTEEKNGAALTQCSLLHRRLGPFDHELASEELLRDDVDCLEDLTSIEIVGRYAPGDRVFVALEFDSSALGAPVRVAARRLEIE